MSLILDALRKMDLERKARKETGSEVRREVLSYRGQTPRPAGVGPAVIWGVVSLLIVLTAALFLYLKPDAVRQQSSLKEQPLPLPVQVAVTPQTVQAPVPVSQPAPIRQQVVATPVTSNERHHTHVPVQKTVVPQKTSGDGLTVSGIAWQDERVLRRAVVNGSLVGEGAMVGDAKIVEIRENRVRFSRGDALFDIQYGGAR